MTDIKARPVPVNLENVRPVTINLDKERHLLFDLNALEELENIYDSIPVFTTDEDGNQVEITSALSKALHSMSSNSRKKIAHIKNFLYAGLAYEDSSLTPAIIGTLISYPNLAKISDQIWEAISQALPSAKEDADTQGE